MKKTKSIICLAFFLTLFLSCKEYHNKLQKKDIINPKEEISFDNLIKCNNYAPDKNGQYFLTPDYGCIYDGGKKNQYGNLNFYLIPKKGIDTSTIKLDKEVDRINSISVNQIKSEFKILAFLIEKKHLNYTKNGDPIYYQKENYTEKYFIYNANLKKWYLKDSITIQENDEMEKELNWKKDITNKYLIKTDQPKNKVSSISEKWYGKYEVTLNNEKDKDWREEINISIQILNNNITFHAGGYQIDQNYFLQANEVNSNLLKLNYYKSADGSESAVLEKIKDFGEIRFDGTNFILKSPYIDESFNDGVKKKFILRLKK